MKFGNETEYVLGIDSGGTKFLVRAADMQGRSLGSYEGAPASINRMPADVMKSRAEENIRTLLEKSGLDPGKCRALVCASTGVDSPSGREATAGVYRGIGGISCPVLCMNDAEAALYASSGETGVIVISGTGSVSFGRDKNGKEWRCGGWPLCIFGDEGSGTWMNLKALEYMSHVSDGRAEKTSLYHLLAEELSSLFPRNGEPASDPKTAVRAAGRTKERKKIRKNSSLSAGGSSQKARVFSTWGRLS